MNMKMYIDTLYVFMQSMRRDFLVYKKDWKKIAINFVIFTPIVFSITTGLLLPRVGLTMPTDENILIFFAGSILWTMFPLGFILNLRFLLDMEYQRFVDYQLLTQSPGFIVLQRMLFTAFVIFINLIPFYPLYLFFSGKWYLAQFISWGPLLLMLFLGALFCSAFTLAVFIFIGKTDRLSMFFIRLNYPLISLGGLMVPWYPIWQNAQWLAYILLANPFMYLTEGLRRALTGKVIFFSIQTAAGGLSLAIILCVISAWYFFKKRLDCV